MFTPVNYDKVAAGNYMKFKEGTNKIRFMSEPITGYMYWVDKDGVVVGRNDLAGEGGKPVRAETYEGFGIEEYANMKPFAAAIVWNYDLEKLQIVEIKQASVMKSLEALALSKSWGDITSYDVLVIKTKTGPEAKNVEYGVMPEPKGETPKEALEAYEKANINLKALYEGEDPFAGKGEAVENVDLDFDEVMKDK
jgi:hypothetical protein